MTLFSLLDRTGSTRAWADRKTGWVSGLNGQIFALVAFDGIFSRLVSRSAGGRATTYRMATVAWSCIDRA